MKTITDIIKTHRKNIKTVKDVEAFFNDLHEFGLSDGFHPDTPFADYIGENGHLFTEDEAGDLDLILGTCFIVCEANDKDIYEIGLNLFHSKTGIAIKEKFDEVMNKSFTLSESLEELLDEKMKEQTADYLNWKHVEDLEKFNEALTAAIENLKR